MDPERWKEVERIYHLVREQAPGEREARLRDECRGNESLRREVDSLLACLPQVESFLESPPLAVAAQALATDQASRPRLDLVGRTLVHYHVLEQIGKGGMGEVYKAEDLRLGRIVALKVMSAELSPNRKALERFRQEARAASALNHPHICTLHDLGEHEDQVFLVMEYLDGKTLAERLKKGRRPLDEVLDAGVQIADALNAAHTNGVIHRDLKPANAMVTAQGQLKVLDFGLAKLTRLDRERGEPSGSSLTESGMVLGTVGYMSPEQVLGHQLDHRTDLFSLGAVLYELATGRGPFAGGTQTEIMDRILHAEPEAIARFNPKAPPELERIVRKSLEKDRERRYQSARELLIDLRKLQRDLELSRQAVQTRRKSLLSAAMPGIVLTAVLAVIAGWWYWMNPQPRLEPETQYTPIPLTSYPGYEDTPSFSPDGTQVAFQSCPEASVENCDIYIKQIGVEGQPFRLTSNPAADFSPAWSPDGKHIAYLRALPGGRAKVMLSPQRGGQERVLAESDLPNLPGDKPGPYVTWTPDSKRLVFPSASRKTAPGLVMLSTETLETKGLTTPPPGLMDSNPAFSPDGRSLAFTRGSENGTDIYFLILDKNYEPADVPRRAFASQGGFALAPAWMPDGREILFFSMGGLWRMEASIPGSAKRLAFASDAIQSTVSRLGNRLAYTTEKWDTNIWSVVFRQPGMNPGIPSRLISSTRMDDCAAFSPDGQKIAFFSDRSGSAEIWVCDRDGSNAVQLTSLGGQPAPVLRFAPKWSPDGRNIVFSLFVGGKYELVVTKVDGGVSRRLSDDTSQPWPSWSRDGRWIYFSSIRSGSREIWKMPAGGGDAVRLTAATGDMPEESPDGRFLYYVKPDRNQSSVWRIPTGGGKETRVLDSTVWSDPYAVAKDGLYFASGTENKSQADLSFLSFATGKTRKLLTIQQPYIWSIAVSPDGRTVLYTQADHKDTDLMLVENFR